MVGLEHFGKHSFLFRYGFLNDTDAFIFDCFEIDKNYNCQNMLTTLIGTMEQLQECLKSPRSQYLINEPLDQDSGIYLSLEEGWEWREELWMIALKPYPPSLSFKKYFTQYCGRLATVITSKSTKFKTIASVISRATQPCKYKNKYLSKTVEQIAQSVALLTNMHYSWIKYEDTAHFEVGRQQLLLDQKSKWECCQLIRQLFLMKNAFEAMKDESDFRRQPYQFIATGKWVYTYIIQSELSQQDRAKKPKPLKGSKHDCLQYGKDKGLTDIPSWDQTTISLLVYKQAHYIFQPAEGIHNDYIFITQHDISNYVEKQGQRFRNMSQTYFNEKYQKLVDQFDRLSQKSAKEHRNSYAIINFTDERLLQLVNKFCWQMRYRTRIFQWNSAKFMKAKDNFLNFYKGKQTEKMVQEQRKDNPFVKQKEKQQNINKMKYFFKNFLGSLTQIIEQSPKQRELIGFSDQEDKEQIKRQLTLFKEQFIQKYQTEINPDLIEQSIKQQKKIAALPAVPSKNESFLQQNYRLIKDSQKRVEMLSCWKELIIHCKYRCKIGSNCQCQINRRQLQSEERYLKKLYKYRDYYQSLQNQKKTQISKISNENQSPTKYKCDIIQTVSMKVQSPSVQPFKKVENWQKISPKRQQKKKKQRDGGDSQWNKLKLKRTLCSYEEQELNLMNMLDQMNLGDYRAPCNVQESKADIWKRMGEKYKKNSKGTNNKKKN